MSKSLVKKLRKAHEGKDRILILLHDHPDPDAMASALALRAVLGRNKQTATIGHFGATVSRPENVAMMELLEIDITPLTVDRVSEFDSVAMVDVQPPFFRGALTKVDSVIDHHPEVGSYEAVFSKISVSEGATSTIMTALLRASDVEISERLATALLYGIKTDTFSLARDADDEDVEAFTFLYKKANLGLLKKIEKAEMPSEELTIFGNSLARHWVKRKVIFVNLGKVEREYMIPKMADFCMQAKDSEWVVSFGILRDSHFVMSLRNVGYVKSAGKVARDIFHIFASDGGSGRVLHERLKQGGGGGHRSAAKVVLPVRGVSEMLGGRMSREKLEKWVTKIVTREIFRA
ncbi:MAG: DHH family phosphoesterase [Thermodesulfobacteriota bacterium]